VPSSSACLGQILKAQLLEPPEWLPGRGALDKYISRFARLAFQGLGPGMDAYHLIIAPACQ
jgi:hypothetical protein